MPKKMIEGRRDRKDIGNLTDEFKPRTSRLQDESSTNYY